jgi:demethylmenaquinone methyltransferase/2-methoxy-6-polyprenyl-1,4-benzoquinol methylase
MTASHDTRDRAVQGMFDEVAPRYDLLNRVISFRLDRHWRQTTAAAALREGRGLFLDMGSGTGDLAFAAARHGHGAARVIGLDFSLEMLRLAQQKKRRAARAAETQFVQGSALLTPFKPAVFDGVMTAFVLRNVSDLAVFFAESQRVLKPGGALVTLDMFPPPKNWFSPLYTFYFYRLVPWIGKILSPRGQAYQYLSESVRRFHSPETIARLIEEAGFERVTLRKFLNGAVCMHAALKPRRDSDSIDAKFLQ